MNTKAVAMCSLFVALAIILDRVRIPVPSFQLYFWEIPIVVALLLFGFRFGFSVAVISVFSQALIFPRTLIIFPITNLIAMSTTMMAVALTQWLIAKWTTNASVTKNSSVKRVILLVTAALILRETIMPFVNYFMFTFIMPLTGQTFPNTAIMGLITLSLIYDAIMVLYTVPSSYFIAKRVNVSLKMGNTLI